MEKIDSEFSPNNTFTQYKNWMGGELPDSWPCILSNKLKYNLENKGVGGSSNYSIFHKFIENKDKIKKGDIVILQWTSVYRFRIAENDFLIDILPNQTYDYIIDSKSLEDILINRSNPIWFTEIINFTKLLVDYCKLRGITILFWDMVGDFFDKKSDYKLIEKYFIKSDIDGKLYHPMEYCSIKSKIKFDVGSCIFQETNGEVNDAHMGKYGHLIQSDMFYEYLKNKKII